MPAYNVKFSYSVEHFDETVINADDPEQAEMFAREHISETYPEYYAIVIDEVKEI